MPLNRVSFYGKSYATEFPFLLKIIQQGLIRKLYDRVSCGRTFCRFLLKQRVLYTFGNILMRQGILLGHFCATGYRAWRDLPHNPISSLVKYPHPLSGGINTAFCGEKLLQTSERFSESLLQTNLHKVS